MFPNKIFVLILSLFVVCESSYVDLLIKCSKDDGECQGKNIQNFMQNIPDDGWPELDMGPLDPLPLQIDVSVLDLFSMSLDGHVKGLKKCTIDKFTPNFERGKCTMDVLCKTLLIKGTYNVSSSGPTVKTMFNGNGIHGEGDGKCKLENVKLHLEMLYDIVKRGEDTFLAGHRDKLVYTYDIGKLTFNANKLYIGDTESSGVLVPLINQNAKSILPIAGKPFVDNAMNLLYGFTNKIFTKIPTKLYIKDDLSSYATN